MNNWRVILVILLCLVLISSVSCNPLGGEEEVTEEPVEVVRGDLTVIVSGSGSIEISNETKLAFGTAGKVDKIYIQESDNVSEGDVLARLETDAMELAVTQAKVAVTQAKVAVTQAEVSVTQAEVVHQTAELELDIAQNKYKWPELEIQQANVDKARNAVVNAYDRLAEAPADQKQHWELFIARVEANLFIEEEKLNAMLSSADTEEVAIKKLQVEAAQQSLELAQQSSELAQQSLELAQQSLEQARKQLSEATITAPFSGVVARVDVKEKDTVSAVTSVIYLIDPSSMELVVQVDEIDVTDVKLGQRAIIEVDALPTVPLEGMVSSISLLPTQEAGIVSYDVKVEFDVPEGTSLRAGMSATADIIITERSDVLLVPDRSITQDSQGNTIVEVKVDGLVKERAVVIGVSDGFQTEVVDGLEEGEVVIERRTKSKSSISGFF